MSRGLSFLHGDLLYTNLFFCADVVPMSLKASKWVSRAVLWQILWACILLNIGERAVPWVVIGPSGYHTGWRKHHTGWGRKRLYVNVNELDLLCILPGVYYIFTLYSVKANTVQFCHFCINNTFITKESHWFSGKYINLREECLKLQ